MAKRDRRTPARTARAPTPGRWRPKFSIGYNFDAVGFRQVLTAHRRHLESAYFPIPRRYLGSGRAVIEMASYETDLPGLLEHARAQGVTPFLLLNAVTVREQELEGVVEYVRGLHRARRVTHVTATDPYLILQLKRAMPRLFVEASMLCRIQTVQEAVYFRELGVDRMTTDRETIRDLPLLERLRQVLPVKVLVNEGCLKGCIFRYCHYNHLSLFPPATPRISRTREELEHLCVLPAMKRPYKVFSAPFVRPEDLHRYRGITDVFKLSTRNFPTPRMAVTVRAYVEQKHDGNLVDLLNTAYVSCLFDHIDNSALNEVRFFETVSTCDDDCDRCGFCQRLLERANVRWNTKEHCRRCSFHGLPEFLAERTGGRPARPAAAAAGKRARRRAPRRGR